MTSQFDALLDFGDSAPPKNGTNHEVDPFDPFGPSPSTGNKGSASSDLLGDFSFDSQISGGQSVNPLYELSMSSGANTNDSQSVNPLYDFNQSEISLGSEKQESANPLYDFMSNSETNGHSVDLLGADVTMETSPVIEDDNLLSSIDAKLKEKSDTGADEDLMNGDGNTESTGDLVNGNGVQEDQALTIKVEKPREEEVETIESLEQEESQTEKEDMGDQLVDTGDQLVDTDDQLVDTGDQLVDTGDQLVDTGDQLVDTGVPLIDTGDQLVDTTEQVLDSEEKRDLMDSQEDTREEENVVTTDDLLDVKEEEKPQSDGEIVEDDDLVEKNINEDFDPSMMSSQLAAQNQDESITMNEAQIEEIRSTAQTEPADAKNEGSLVQTDEPVVPEMQICPPGPEEPVVQVETEPEVVEETRVEEEVTTETSEEDGSKATSKTVKTTEETTTKSKDAGAGQESTTTTTKTTREVVQNGDIGNTEEIRFDEMSNIKTKFESGESDSSATQHKPTVQEEIMSVEGGVYENEPVRDPNVVREADRAEEELPEVGYAKNILNKFKEIQVEKSQPVTSQRRVTPERQTGPVEYVSEPRASVPVPEQKLEGGIFENQPKYEEGVIRSYDAVEDVKPEHGYAKNVLAKFKEIESTTKNRPPPSPKKELTPDRFTKGEYVSEPRTVFEKYEGKTEAGVFESQPAEARDIVKSGEMVDEPLPERGTAKNLASKFAQYESQAKSPPTPHQKKELTPDRFTKGEYVSEPRTVFQHYEAKEESGIYESQPQERPEVVKSGEYMDEPLPEQGYAKNVISKFREIQSGTSPVSSPQRPREITPPRGDTFSGVLESTPQERPDVIKSDQQFEEALPETGMAKNLVSKFRQIQTTSQSPTSPRQKKEFTPPPQSGVYENTPTQSLVVENKPVESGILETSPQVREGVAREGDVSAGDVEFPEHGYAKNMVSKWRQIESDSAKSTPSPRYKEFTPPRDDVRTARGPLSPRSPAGVDSSVHPSDLPGQYQEQISPGVFENDPYKREDIAREEDTDWAEGLPKEGTSKSLISKFKQVQADAKKSQETPKPVSRKDSTDDPAPQMPNTQMFERRNENEAVRNGVRSSPIATQDENVDTDTDVSVDQIEDTNAAETPKSTFAVQLDKCTACQKTVYAMEKVEMNKNLYHRACFKCSHCNTRLTAKTFSLNEGIMYCTNHFKQLFARKGNYDEGFGRQQYKKRWQGDSPNEQSPSKDSA